MVGQQLEDGTHFVKLSKGEEIVGAITRYCKSNQIRIAKVHAIGALRNVELGYYHLKTKSYSWRTFTEDHELASATGNITLLNEEPFLHMHVVLGDTDFSAHAGHLKSGEVGATCEVIIQEYESEKSIYRLMDEEIGLNLWCL